MCIVDFFNFIKFIRSSDQSEKLLHISQNHGRYLCHVDVDSMFLSLNDQVAALETRIEEVNGDIQKGNDELKTMEIKAAACKHIRDLKVATPASTGKKLQLKTGDAAGKTFCKII